MTKCKQCHQSSPKPQPSRDLEKRITHILNCNETTDMQADESLRPTMDGQRIALPKKDFETQAEQCLEKTSKGLSYICKFLCGPCGLLCKEKYKSELKRKTGQISRNIAKEFVETLWMFYFAQDHLLFHPDDNQSRIFVQTPYLLDLPYENVFIKSIDGTLINMYFITQPPGEMENVPTLVFFHGNAGNMGHRLDNAAGLYRNLKCNVLLVEYRGYGLSKGSPSESGLCKDAQAAIDYLASRTDVNHKKVIVFGRSLGGAVAIDLASRPEYAARIWCLVLENTFTSIPDIAQSLFKWKGLQYVPIIFYKNKFLSKMKVNSVMMPTLFISGLSDTLVPPSMMMELYLKSGSQMKRLVKIPTGGHNDTWTYPGYYLSINSFLEAAEEYLPTPPPVRSCISSV